MIFSNELNVLTATSKVNAYPFPHLGTFHCLPDEIYAELAAKRPPWQAIAQEGASENNKRIDASALRLLESKTLDKIWKDFISYHTSRDFYLQILDRFEFYFKEFYPRLNDMRKYKTDIRYTNSDADIFMDCQLSVNTPVKTKSTVNHPHVDHPRELFASLLYMKEPEDNAGGNLVFYRAIKPPTFHPKREVDLHCVRPAMCIPYLPNSYVAFINSPLSIHGVTEREITEKPRLMVNISLEFMNQGEELFDVKEL